MAGCSYEEVPPVDVEHGAGDERRRVGGKELVRAGEVEVTADGAGLRIEPLADGRLEDEEGLLVIPAADVTVSDDLVRTLRDADQR